LNPTAEHFSIIRHSIAAEAASIIVSLILGMGVRAFMAPGLIAEADFPTEA
jgi:hypothetical protein